MTITKKGKHLTPRAKKRRLLSFLRRPHGWRQWLALVILLPVALFMILFFVAYAFAHIPDPNDISTAQSVLVFDHNGHLIGRIHSDADRVSIPISQMPLDLQHAVIATEDRTFYSNPGISIGG